MTVVPSQFRRRQKPEDSVTSVSFDHSVTLPAETSGQCHLSVVTSQCRRRQKLEGSVTTDSCDLTVTPQAETFCH